MQHLVSTIESPLAPTATLSAAIIGASGYAGRELTRLLGGHPSLKVGVAQARSDGYAPLDVDTAAAADVAFLALPHGESAAWGEALAAADVPVVDLGSDFRLDPAWRYGLPELFRDELAGCRRVANPGCYATAALLALAPLVEAGLAEARVVADGKSGVSGAGRSPSERTHLSEASGGVQPYQPVGHRHVAEIERTLGRLADDATQVTFTPHLAPHSRGLEVTCYVPLRHALSGAQALELYAERYAGEPFVTVNQAPHPGRLHGANACHLGVWVDERTQTAIVAAAIDNLVKGAAGQAIQNANLMLGLPETAGLTAEGLVA